MTKLQPRAVALPPDSAEWERVIGLQVGGRYWEVVRGSFAYDQVSDAITATLLNEKTQQLFVMRYNVEALVLGWADQVQPMPRAREADPDATRKAALDELARISEELPDGYA